MSVYYFNSGTSWVVPAGVTGIQVECYGSTGTENNSGFLSGNYPGGSYSKSNLINVTAGSTVYMSIGSFSTNTWFNTTNTAPTSASSPSSACLAVGGNTASASQIAANCGDVKYRGGNGFNTSSLSNTLTAQGGQAGPNGNGADVVGPFTNAAGPSPYFTTYKFCAGGGANGGSSGSVGVPPYGRSGTGTVGSGAYWNGSAYIRGSTGGIDGAAGFADIVGQYLYLNNTATTPTNYGPVGGSCTVAIFNGSESDFGFTLVGQTGFIVITLVIVNGRKTVTLTGSGTWDLPADWNDADNVIEVYGPGGNGATSGSTVRSGGGGGGGAYQKALNVPLKAIDLLGTVVTAKTYNLTVGIGNGAGLWQGYQYESDGDFYYGTLIQGGGGFFGSGITGGLGGFAQAVINNVNYTIGSSRGGDGGNGRSATTAAGGGGGGAAGPYGVGGAGGSNTTTLGTTGRGGGGGNGGGAGSSTSATGGTAGIGAGAGGNGGANNFSGSAGGAFVNGYGGAFSVSYVSQGITVPGGTIVQGYNKITNTIIFTLYGGGSSVNNQNVSLEYSITVTEISRLSYNLRASSEANFDFGSLFAPGIAELYLSGTQNFIDSRVLTTGTYSILLGYSKNASITSGSDTFSGSLSFSNDSCFSGGGGGGAGDGTTGTSGGAGGLFGGGGGGSGSATSSVGGAGRPGIIIITYTPLGTTNSNFFMFF